ncbi:hypothetical protein NL676_008332 [Syzygium grande]|nr:hypothetical protein NL676_008332 [Syzygium grande]
MARPGKPGGTHIPCQGRGVMAQDTDGGSDGAPHRRGVVRATLSLPAFNKCPLDGGLQGGRSTGAGTLGAKAGGRVSRANCSGE